MGKSLSRVTPSLQDTSPSTEEEFKDRGLTGNTEFFVDIYMRREIITSRFFPASTAITGEGGGGGRYCGQVSKLGVQFYLMTRIVR
jgi:hypothetical protein